MKSILFCMTPTPGEAAGLPACASYAIDLAARLGAHLSIVGVAPRLEASVFLPVPAVASLFAEDDRRRGASARALADAMHAECRARGVPSSAEALHAPFPELSHRLLSRAHVHEAVLFARPEAGDLVTPGLLDALLFESGRPVILVDRGANPSADLKRIVVGWDGGAMAANAVWNALPLLKSAEMVEIVSVTQDKDLAKSVPGAELAPSLARHGIQVTVTDLPRQGGSAGKTLLGHASLVRADLLVVGAYAHSRWRQIILGGVTADLLGAASIPVFMSR